MGHLPDLAQRAVERFDQSAMARIGGCHGFARDLGRFHVRHAIHAHRHAFGVLFQLFAVQDRGTRGHRDQTCLADHLGRKVVHAFLQNIVELEVKTARGTLGPIHDTFEIPARSTCVAHEVHLKRMAGLGKVARQDDPKTLDHVGDILLARRTQSTRHIDQRNQRSILEDQSLIVLHGFDADLIHHRLLERTADHLREHIDNAHIIPFFAFRPRS